LESSRSPAGFGGGVVAPADGLGEDVDFGGLADFDGDGEAEPLAPGLGELVDPGLTQVILSVGS
jgi:hypothetical protein